MAQTARDTIKRAMVMLGVLVGGRDPTASEALDALKALNSMIHGWKAQGVDVGHVDLALSDQLALAEEHHEATTALLAVRLAGDYLTQVPPSTALIAANGWSGLQAKYICDSPANDLMVETALRRLGGFRNYGYWPYG